jgi:tRNA(Ile)-lysidine synthase
MQKQSEQNSKTQKAFLNKANGIIVRLNMLNTGDRVLAGVSGGPDSVALLLVLLEIRAKYSLDIGIAHLNHMLRGKDADRDEAFVLNIAKKFSIPCYTERKDVALFAKENHLSMEDSARKIRYAFLKSVMNEEKYSKIALGHNRDDNAELILMNILRGSGTKGLTGIPPIREKVIIRPLLEISKKQILVYLKLMDQSYVTDGSNNENIYLRNSIRNSFIPQIEKEYNPKIKESLIRLSEIIKDEDEWMESETELAFSKAIKNGPFDNLKQEMIELDINIVKESHPALKKRMIRNAIKLINGNLKKISSQHVEDAVKLLLSTTSGESIDLPDRIRVFKEKESLFFKKESMPLRELGKKRKIERKR